VRQGTPYINCRIFLPIYVVHSTKIESMSNYLRNSTAGGLYFFTVNLADRRNTLLVDHIDALRDALQITWHSRPFKQHAIVVLPDHLHCIWQLPEGDSDYCTRWSHIKSIFSRSFPANEHISESRYFRRERGIWQRRFWEHHIRDETDYLAHVEYIKNNPVKHGYVTNACDWPYLKIRKFPSS
jgi:putative transposase